MTAWMWVQSCWNGALRSVAYDYKIGDKYYSPRGKSVNQLLAKLGSGEIKKLSISGCILEKINNSIKISKEK